MNGQSLNAGLFDATILECGVMSHHVKIVKITELTLAAIAVVGRVFFHFVVLQA